MQKILLTTTLLALSATCAADITCRVVGVADGDTLTCLTADNTQVRVRLAQIDAPEKSQPWGERSKQHLSDAVFRHTVRLSVETTDKYGRTVATVWRDSRDINIEQVQSGMAWVYTQYAHDPAYTAAERTARAARAGLWADANSVPPWEFRRTGKSSTATEKPAAKQSTATCGSKRYCGEMNSCAEAKHYLNVCGVSRLDRDGDGVPCESICR